jgi:hypothetical protein
MPGLRAYVLIIERQGVLQHSGETFFIRATVMGIALKLIDYNVADYCTKRVTVIRWKTMPVTVFYFLLGPGLFRTLPA